MLEDRSINTGMLKNVAEKVSLDPKVGLGKIELKKCLNLGKRVWVNLLIIHLDFTFRYLNFLQMSM